MFAEELGRLARVPLPASRPHAAEIAGELFTRGQPRVLGRIHERCEKVIAENTTTRRVDNVRVEETTLSWNNTDRISVDYRAAGVDM
jgi:hypothetical protein